MIGFEKIGGINMSKPMKIIRVKDTNWEVYRRKQVLKIAAVIVSLLVMIGLIVWGIFIIINDMTKYTQDAVPSNAVMEKPYTEGDALSYVVIDVSENDFSQADTFTLIKFSAMMKGVVVVTLPSDTYVEFGEKSGTLKSIFAQYGHETVLDALGELLGYRPEGYVDVNNSIMERLVDAFDGLSLTVLEDVKSQTGGNISYAKGTHRLSGRQVIDIIEYDQWSAGESERLIITSKIHAALINENCVNGTVEKFTKYYNAIYNTVNGETNVSMIVFDRALDGIIYISGFNQDSITKIFPISGTQVEEKGYVLSQETIDELKMYYKYDK